MPIKASLRDLKDIEEQLAKIKEQYPEAYEAMSTLVDEERHVGYKNFCKLLMESTTPEEMKGID